MSHICGKYPFLQDFSFTFAQMVEEKKKKKKHSKQPIYAVMYLADILFSGRSGISKTFVLAIIIS